MFSTATCSCDVSTSVLGGHSSVQRFGILLLFLPFTQQSENNEVQLVSGSAAAALPGLHLQATLSNSLLGLTCYTFTTSSGPGNVPPAAPCCWEGTCQEPQLSCRGGVELCSFYMVHLKQDGARSIKIKQLHLSTFKTRYQNSMKSLKWPLPQALLYVGGEKAIDWQHLEVADCFKFCRGSC